MPTRLKPLLIDNVLDGRKLRVQLTAVALDCIGDENATRAGALKLLSGALFRGRMIAQERLEDGASGLETARLLSQVQDEVIAALYDFTTTHVFRSRNPTTGERLAVAATGGYGRAALAPSSDIDLVFLRAYKSTPWTESVIEYMLYMLWDMGLKVGHASRTIEECVRLSREDQTIATALLDLRHIVGDAALSAELKQRYRRDVVPGSERSYVTIKLKERDDRHKRAGQSRYLVEPNIKEGKGGLRDLHSLDWIAKYIYGLETRADYEQLGFFRPEELDSLGRATDFLWSVRCHLHFLTGRAEERLTFDLQPEMARRLGYRDRAESSGVERFMKHYFLVAQEVGALTRVFCAKLEADEQKRAPRGLTRFLPRRDGAGRTLIAEDGFIMDAGRLSIVDPRLFEREPHQQVRLFQLADARDLDLHPDALTAVRRSLRHVTPAVRKDPRAIAAFLEIVASRKNPAGALRLMNEAGLLGRFVPEFGRIVAQTQFNMYHHYTVDEHTLRGIEVISDIEHGRHREDHPLATEIFPLIQNRRALYLAMLLHDTGKGKGDQQTEGGKAARAACERLNLPQEDVDLVVWLVSHHLVMSDVAQRRDLSDARTITAFSDLVGTPERLRLLLVLTVADIRAVGVGVFNGWKGALLRELYKLSEAAFRGGRAGEAAVRQRLHERAQEAQQQLAETVGAALTPTVQAWLDTLEDAYWIAFEPDALAWHVRERASAGAAPIVAARVVSKRAATEVLVGAQDREGLFAALVGALAAAGASVTDARVFTTTGAQAFDVFSIQDLEGRPFAADDPGRLNRLIGQIQAAAVGGEPGEPAAPGAAARRTAAFAIEPLISIDPDASDDCTVLEVSGRDRPGFLRDVARTVAQCGMAVHSAHIQTIGERAVDAFYLKDRDGGPITNARRLAQLKARLEETLRAHEPDGPLTLARRRLAQARASALR